MFQEIVICLVDNVANTCIQSCANISSENGVKDVKSLLGIIIIVDFIIDFLITFTI